LINDLIYTLRSNIRVTALVAVVIALIVTNIMLYMPMKDASAERESLETREAGRKAQLEGILSQEEKNLEELQAEIDEVRASIIRFPEEFPTDQFGIYLAKGAETYKIELLSIAPPSGQVNKIIGGKNFPAYNTNISVKGELHYIISYFKYIEEGRYSSIETGNVRFTRSADVWSASFTITFVTWA